MMQSSIWQMVCTRTSDDSILDIPEGPVGHGRGQVPCGGAPPHPPVSLEQLLATQNDLMRRLVENNEHRGAERQQPRHQERDSSYSFLATHPPVFADATGPLEVDSWLRTMEYKFGLLHCTEYQKTMYTAQLEHGGLPTSPPYLMITMFHGVNSVLPFVHITYLWVYSTASCRSSWTLSKGTIVYSTARGSSTLLLNTVHTTLTWMKRRTTCTMRGSPSICRSTSHISPACCTRSW
jgi:hypothetical protein